MDVVHSRCAGIDCLKRDAKVCVRIQGQGLLSVRRVTDLNAGRNTAGVDGRVVLAKQREQLNGSHLAAGLRPR
jgi:hypothetical protein